MLNKLTIITIALLTICSITHAQNTDNGQSFSIDTTTTTAIRFPAMPTKPSGTAWIVISKKDLTLSVYDRNATGDTLIMAQFPWGSSGVLLSPTIRYASGTLRRTEVITEIHIGVTVSPAPRIVPDKHWVTSIRMYPKDRILIIR